MITPPVGLNCFVVARYAERPVAEVFRERLRTSSPISFAIAALVAFLRTFLLAAEPHATFRKPRRTTKRVHGSEWNEPSIFFKRGNLAGLPAVLLAGLRLIVPRARKNHARSR